MAEQCDLKDCNRTGLYLCRGCRGWFCGHYVADYRHCNEVSYPASQLGTAVCRWCVKEGIE